MFYYNNQIVSKHWTVNTTTVCTYNFVIAVECSDNRTRLVDTRNYVSIFNDANKVNRTIYASQVQGLTLHDKLLNWVQILKKEEEEKKQKIKKSKNSLELKDILTTYELTGQLSPEQTEEIKKYTYNQYDYRAMGSEMYRIEDCYATGTGQWLGSNYIPAYNVKGDVHEVSPYLLEKLAVKYKLPSARQILKI